MLHGTEIAYMDKQPDSAASMKDMDVSKSIVSAASKIDTEDVEDDPCGFALLINDFDTNGDAKTPTWYLRAESIEGKKEWLSKLCHLQAIIRWFDDFERVRVLGVGGNGTVYELKHKATKERFAMKEINVLNKAQTDLVVAEARMLMDVSKNVAHPNIIKIDKIFQVRQSHLTIFLLGLTLVKLGWRQILFDFSSV